MPRRPGDPLVEAELRRRIRARGRITFAEFMEVALYWPAGGYYEAHAEIGRRGDFLTSPETHPVFGALLARLGLLMWQALGAPGSCSLIEYGAGTGSLCRQILEAAPRLDPGFAAALDYHIVEVSAFLRALQQARLMDLADRVRWLHPRESPQPAVGLILANEVVDAFPVHRLRVVKGDLKEIYVGMAGDRYLQLLGPPSRPELEAYLRDQQVQPPEGSVVEINLAAREWLRDVSSRLQRGYVLTVDFGGSAQELYGAAGPRGQLKCFSHHAWTDDPYDQPGLQDITAPVDFTDLKRTGGALGLEVMLESSQGESLSRLGLARALEWLEESPLPISERQRNLRAIEALADPKGLGGFRALMQRKEAPAVALTEDDWRGTDWVPLLPEERISWPE